MRRWLILGPMAIVTVGALFVLSGLVALLIRPAPIAYSRDVYPVARTVVAPGESLEYTPTLTVKYGGYLKTTRSYYQRDTKRAALLCDGTPAPSQTSEVSFPPEWAGELRDNPALPRAIPNLRPGKYQMSVSTTSVSDTGQDSYQIFFEVVKKCG